MQTPNRRHEQTKQTIDQIDNIPEYGPTRIRLTKDDLKLTSDHFLPIRLNTRHKYHLLTIRNLLDSEYNFRSACRNVRPCYQQQFFSLVVILTLDRAQRLLAWIHTYDKVTDQTIRITVNSPFSTRKKKKQTKKQTNLFTQFIDNS